MTTKEEALEWFGTTMKTKEFTLAKTMPKYPHEYTLRRTWESVEDFERCCTIIKEFGYNEPFYGHPFMKLAVDGWKYWTMGSPLHETILINRADLNEKGDWLPN